MSIVKDLLLSMTSGFTGKSEKSTSSSRLIYFGYVLLLTPSGDYVHIKAAMSDLIDGCGFITHRRPRYFYL